MTSAIIGTLAGAVVAAVVSIIVALIARGTDKEGNAVTFSRDLMERVEGLEGRVEKSEKVLGHALRYIDRVVEWGRRREAGAHEPMPQPPKYLHQYLDSTEGTDAPGAARPKA